MASQRFRSYFLGSVMLLVGLLFLGIVLLGTILLGLLPALFIIGLGVIFFVFGVIKLRAPLMGEMSPRTTLGYAFILLFVGVVLLSRNVTVTIVGYVILTILVFFALAFLAYVRFR